jgi:hypothetical protein
MLNEYEQETKERWGDTDAYKQSTSRTTKYTKDDFAAAKVDQEAATEKFVIAFGNSYAVTSTQAQDAVHAHRAAISKWFYECSIEMQKNLAVMYIEDITMVESEGWLNMSMMRSWHRSNLKNTDSGKY